MAKEEIFEPAGLAEGTVLGDEVVVYDRNEAGVVIGWHKEAA